MAALQFSWPTYPRKIDIFSAEAEPSFIRFLSNIFMPLLPDQAIICMNILYEYFVSPGCSARSSFLLYCVSTVLAQPMWATDGYCLPHIKYS
ncbi:hypothetical protein IE077_002205 [Cardiosporidium cionae]|uniref:Uncharacterized protein n=1 Tax=Cardiosporidium cionae TaxID=476202 RepID=A0ABQ7JCB6_9APIC|nr:hypothetical protein IE077_002205 [Cardiosporidium cionae]|eukprot:KAF8821290.1 hypothetical protein IE077_002205 [Cardiosporidium cionae]